LNQWEHSVLKPLIRGLDFQVGPGNDGEHYGAINAPWHQSLLQKPRMRLLGAAPDRTRPGFDQRISLKSEVRKARS
jgi:hypothetical protein